MSDEPKPEPTPKRDPEPYPLNSVRGVTLILVVMTLCAITGYSIYSESSAGEIIVGGFLTISLLMVRRFFDS